MRSYVTRRLLTMIPVLPGVTVLVFFLAQLLPGDPARAAAGRLATPEQLEAVRERLGLDRSLPTQYALYIGRLLQGDLGTSLTSKQEVAQELRIFFPATLELLLATMVITIVIGIAIGVRSATGRGGWVDRAFLGFSYLGSARSRRRDVPRARHHGRRSRREPHGAHQVAPRRRGNRDAARPR